MCVRIIAIAVCAFAGPAYGTDSSLLFIDADDVHAQGITGYGVTVAVIDTGVDLSHPGLIGDIAPGGISFEGGAIYHDHGADVYGWGHGTYMSLIITDSWGVAPAAKVLPIRVFGFDGATDEDIITAIRYTTALRRADSSIRVMNLSLGSFDAYFPCPCDLWEPRYEEAIADAESAGIITFAATGNEAYCGGICSPACVSSAVKVAADYDSDYGFVDHGVCGDPNALPYRVTCFSNQTNDCDYLLAAPGYDIVVGEFSGDGTSQATAHCSGVAALMFEKNACGSLDAESARAAIFNAATDYWWAYPYCAMPPQPRHLNALAAVNAVAAGPCGSVGDMDCDSTVSLLDYERFEGCMTGPGGGPVAGACACADYPSSPPDGDVDLRDFAAFQVAFSGYGEGACCYPDGACTEGPVIDCMNTPGAAYQGHETTCATVQCPLPNWGACCDVATQTCTESTREDCVWAEGFYMGDGTDCAAAECPTPRYQNVIDPLLSYTSAGPGRQLGDDITLSGAGPYSLAFYDLGVFGGGGGSFDVTVGLYTDCPGAGGTLIPGTERTFTDNADNGSPVFLAATFNPSVSIPNTFWMVAMFSTNQAGWFRAEEAEIGFTANRFGRNDPPWVCNYWFGGTPYAGFWANVGCVESRAAAGHRADTTAPACRSRGEQALMSQVLEAGRSTEEAGTVSGSSGGVTKRRLSVVPLPLRGKRGASSD